MSNVARSVARSVASSPAGAVAAGAVYELTFGGDTTIDTGYVPDMTVHTKLKCTFNSATSPTSEFLFSQSTTNGATLKIRGASYMDFVTYLYGQNNSGIDAWTILTERIVELEWRHSGTSARFIVDGGSPTTVTLGTSARSGNLFIGALSSGSSGFTGVIKNFEVYEAGTRIHAWNIDDKNGTVIADSVGSQNGTLTIGSGEWR